MRKNFMLTAILITIIGFFMIQCGSGEGENKSKGEATKDSSKMSTDSNSLENNEGTKENKQEQKNDEDLIPVEITKVAKGSISNFILLSSNLETEIMADVYARIQGIVEKIHKEEGQYVRSGETLLSLEAEEYELAERKARINYEKEKSNVERLREMHRKQLISDDEFERAQYVADAAEVSWKEAKLNLDFMQIQSPISGWIGERLAKVGARIQQTDKLFTVVNQSQVIAVVWVPEKNINEINIGQPAVLTSDHLQNKRYEGFVKRISPVVDPASGTCKVTIGVKNVDRALRPGMFVNVHIIIDTHDDVILIPKTAVVYEKEYMNVFIVRDSVAHKIRLKPGFEDHEKIESLNDEIQTGDQLIVVGQAGMKDQTRVKVVSERENYIVRQ
jgi:membrane fusion protein (multidrug efflux system)